MSDPVIIDARRHLRWYQRLASSSTAAVLWAMWAWLWLPLQHRHAQNLQLEESSFELVKLSSMLLATAWLLALWTARKQAKPAVANRFLGAPAVELPSYAAHFGLPEAELARGLRSSKVIVHHDDSGRIVSLDAQD